MILAIGLGGCLGAPLRFLIDWLVPRRTFPFGILLVNIIASFTLGIVISASLPPLWHAALAQGFCGALSSFSTISFDITQEIERRQYRIAATNIAANLGLGVAALVLGKVLGQLLLG